MKIQTFDKCRPSEKSLNLKLEDASALCPNRRVVLRAVNEKGYPIPSGNILDVSESGIDLRPAVTPEIGLPLTGGYVKVHGFVPDRVIHLVEPIANYFDALLRSYGMRHPDYPMLNARTAYVTFGDLHRVAEFYKHNK